MPHRVSWRCAHNLAELFDSAAKHEEELTLFNLTNKAQDVPQIARLYTVFDFMYDEPAAVTS